MYKRAAGALGEIKDARAVELLINAFNEKDLETIAGAYSFFIRRGEQGTEAVLIEALNKYGFESMAIAFLNCGNSHLGEAAEKWAKENGYLIITTPSGNGLRWGSGQ